MRLINCKYLSIAGYKKFITCFYFGILIIGDIMFNSIRVLQIGCGKMSKYIMRYIFEKGGMVVAGIDINPELINQDIGVVMGTNQKVAIIYPVSKLEQVILSARPNIAIVTTMSLLNDIGDILKICARNGINVITTCEEAFYPVNSNPKLFKEIDDLARQTKCKITGCGYQDTFWGNLVYTLAGNTHQINKIVGSSSYNVEDYGIALAKAHGAGLTIEEFNLNVASADNISEMERNVLIENGTFLPSYMWNTVGWLADRLGFKIKHMEQKCTPVVLNTDLHSDTLKMDIPAGCATGMNATVTATTEEGIILEATCTGKVYTPSDFDKNEWTIEGEPTTTFVVNRPDTVLLTCANVVNRIPDVLNYPEGGFISTSKMDANKYLKTTFKDYIK